MKQKLLRAADFNLLTFGDFCGLGDFAQHNCDEQKLICGAPRFEAWHSKALCLLRNNVPLTPDNPQTSLTVFQALRSGPCENFAVNPVDYSG